MGQPGSKAPQPPETGCCSSASSVCLFSCLESYFLMPEHQHSSVCVHIPPKPAVHWAPGGLQTAYWADYLKLWRGLWFLASTLLGFCCKSGDRCICLLFEQACGRLSSKHNSLLAALAMG